MLYRALVDGYCSTVQALLDWFEVDLGSPSFPLFRLICVLCVFLCSTPASHSPLVLCWTFCVVWRSMTRHDYDLSILYDISQVVTLCDRARCYMNVIDRARCYSVNVIDRASRYITFACHTEHVIHVASSISHSPSLIDISHRYLSRDTSYRIAQIAHRMSGKGHIDM